MGYIHNKPKIISKHELTNLPQFLRFDHVELDYQNIYQTLSIVEKCQSVVNYLEPLKLSDSNLIHFIGAINKNNRSHFSNHSQLLDHLQNELLPIWGSSRGYKFEIYLFLDEVSHTNLIAQILQLPRIDCCSNVEIKLPLSVFTMHPMQFPIETISNWLHRNCNGTEERSKKRFLRIYSSSFLCARELCNHLKKVTFVIYRKFLGYD